jgi:dTDP-4-dehydrorhamnose reductase
LRTPDRIAVTGARGRLGSALMALLPNGFAWSRPEYDLDDPGAAEALLERDRPELVIHAAAWTDVDGCARQPDLARRRNSSAVKELAAACARRKVALALVSTNEVFDGNRSDGRGYSESDPTYPLNPYGVSKLEGEQAAREVMSSESLWIVRTAWLYGPPGNDFPTKIIAAADRLADGEALKVVSDEWGSPTYAPDLAAGILALLERSRAGLFHLVNGGETTRHDWAAAILRACRPARRLIPISRDEFERSSRAPRWAVLDASRAREHGGVDLRQWEDALSDYLDLVCARR